MSRTRRAALALAGSMALAGCGTLDVHKAVVIVDGVPSGPCQMHPTPGSGPFLQCPIAVDLAANELGNLSAPPSAVEFHRGVLCPPNARCLAQTDVGTVVVWFDEAPPVMVRITFVVSLGFVAQPPEVPPQWLIDQGQAGAAGT